MYPVPKILVVQVFVDKGLVLVVFWVDFGVLVLEFVAASGMDVVLVKVIGHLFLLLGDPLEVNLGQFLAGTVVRNGHGPDLWHQFVVRAFFPERHYFI